jgi:tetratricopeptide (TPR) repeat protein
MAGEAGISNRHELEQVMAAGRESLAEGQYEEAARLLRLVDGSPLLDEMEKPQLWLDIATGVKHAAIEAFSRPDYWAAADFFRQLLDEPYVPGWGNAEISYNLGQSLLQLQDYDGARYYLEQSHGRSTPDINQRTRELLQRLDRLDDALAVVEPHLVP